MREDCGAEEPGPADRFPLGLKARRGARSPGAEPPGEPEQLLGPKSPRSQEWVKPELLRGKGDLMAGQDGLIFVGLDIGKRQVAVALGKSGDVRQFSNNAEGIEQVLEMLSG